MCTLTGAASGLPPMTIRNVGCQWDFCLFATRQHPAQRFLVGASLRQFPHDCTPKSWHHWKLCHIFPVLPAQRCRKPHVRRGNARSRSEACSATEAWHKAACGPGANSAGASESPCSHPSPCGIRSKSPTTRPRVPSLGLRMATKRHRQSPGD